MKVKELIEKLKEMPPEVPVVVHGCQICAHGVDEIHENKMHSILIGEEVSYVALTLKDDWP